MQLFCCVHVLANNTWFVRRNCMVYHIFIISSCIHAHYSKYGTKTVCYLPGYTAKQQLSWLHGISLFTFECIVGWMKNSAISDTILHVCSINCSSLQIQSSELVRLCSQTKTNARRYVEGFSDSSLALHWQNKVRIYFAYRNVYLVTPTNESKRQAKTSHLCLNYVLMLEKFFQPCA